MRQRKWKGLWYCLLMIMVLFHFTACGNKQKTENQGLSTERNMTDDSSDEISVDELKDDDEIHFSDFLVERCVRKTLNKSWDDKITKKDAARVQSLLIDPIYNPSIGISFTGASPFFTFYEGYIDLSDLKYLTGLEILKIDNLVNYDMVVHVDSISNCKKLKQLYMQWNPTLFNPYSGIGYGYKYWADIIGELPALEYVDLGIYVDSHMKEVMLSKTSNKNIIFYNGNNDRYAKQPLNTDIASYPNHLVITDAQHYDSVMRYEYDGNDIDLYDGNEKVLGQIPVLSVNSIDELQQAIHTLSETTEDLFIRLWKDCTEFDCNLLSKFKKLNTLTIIKNCVYLRVERDGFITLKNADKMTELPYLQVINLSACEGDISYLKNVKNLRELTLFACKATGISELGKLERLTELKLYASDCGNIKKEFDSVEGNDLKSLKYYRCFESNETYETTKSCIALLEHMPKLQTLSVPMDIPDLKILNYCSELENLHIWGLSNEKEYDLKDLASLSQLKTICIFLGQAVNVSEILNLPDIVSVVLPNAIHNLDSKALNELFQNASSVHNKLSMLAVINGPDASYTKEDVKKFDKAHLKLLYDKGIHDGFVQVKIRNSWSDRENTFEEAWSEIQKLVESQNS